MTGRTPDYEHTTKVGASPDFVQILGRRPGRHSILVYTESFGASLIVAPFKTASDSGIGPATGTGAVLLTAAALPGLIEGEWYAIAGVLTTIHIVEFWYDTPGG